MSDDPAAKQAYKKYGRSVRNTKYKAGNNYQNTSFVNENIKLNRSSYDVFIFWFFILLGVNMLLFGILDVIKSKDDDKINFAGILVAVPFLIILITGWNIIKKHKSDEKF